MFLKYIVTPSILIPIIFMLINFNRAKKDARLIFSYLILSGLINLIAITVMKRNNLPLLHLYTIVEAVLIISYLRTLFIEPLIKSMLLYISIIFSALCMLNFIFLQSMGYNTYTRPLEAIIITFFCLLYLYKSGFTENWINKPTSWFNMGILLYFPVVCIIYILSNHMTFVIKDKSMNRLVWDFHGIMVLIMYSVWARGFYLLKKDG